MDPLSLLGCELSQTFLNLLLDGLHKKRMSIPALDEENPDLGSHLSLHPVQFFEVSSGAGPGPKGRHGNRNDLFETISHNLPQGLFNQRMPVAHPDIGLEGMASCMVPSRAFACPMYSERRASSDKPVTVLTLSNCSGEVPDRRGGSANLNLFEVTGPLKAKRRSALSFV
jgi:hypothetical protein